MLLLSIQSNSLIISLIRGMETAYPSKTLVSTYKTTGSNSPENFNLHVKAYYYSEMFKVFSYSEEFTLNLLTTTIVAPPSNASKWQMGFNSAFKGLIIFILLLQWPRGLRRRSSAARLLRLWVRIPPGAWMFVCLPVVSVVCCQVEVSATG